MNCTEKNEKAMSWLKDNLDEERLLHSLGTAECAVELAQKFKLDESKAYSAGLLHDCAKCFKLEKQQQLAQGLNLDDKEFSNAKLLHAPVSALIAETEFGVIDEEILSAIRWHTLGKKDMSTFEKIIFLADKIEPNTRDLEYRNTILMFLNDENDLDNGLNKALFLCYKETIKSLVKRDLKICQTTIEIYNSMLDK